MALGAQAGHEAQPVEIAAGQLAVAQADRVDGADQARGRRDLVAQDGGLFLVGHGDDQPAQVMQAAQAGEQRRQAVGRDVERDHDAVGAALAQRALSRCGVLTCAIGSAAIAYTVVLPVIST